jgi:hypothetical protein
MPKPKRFYWQIADNQSGPGVWYINHDGDICYGAGNVELLKYTPKQWKALNRLIKEMTG